jgi:hypothetical protein
MKLNIDDFESRIDLKVNKSETDNISNKIHEL